MKDTSINQSGQWSLSAWKSLAVKALRIGWAPGLERAQRALGKSDMKQILICGVFEDIFPAESELAAVMDEIRRLDYRALCSRETHHARGHTQRFCDLKPQALEARDNKKRELWDEARRWRIWLPLRSLNCWFTWLAIKPQDAGKIRDVDETPWMGMPMAMIDAHTLEGKQTGKSVTLLSGHYHNHLAISQRVAREGWAGIRAEAHREIAPGAVSIGQAEFSF